VEVKSQNLIRKKKRPLHPFLITRSKITKKLLSPKVKTKSQLQRKSRSSRKRLRKPIKKLSRPRLPFRRPLMLPRLLGFQLSHNL